MIRSLGAQNVGGRGYRVVGDCDCWGVGDAAQGGDVGEGRA